MNPQEEKFDTFVFDTYAAVDSDWEAMLPPPSLVEHPRYEPRPRKVIDANLDRQTLATVPVTQYFDVEKTCRDCARPFIFFAEEQQYWYEVLGFGLDSDCVRCVPCRKRQQGISRLRVRYEELFHVPARTVAENLEFADCCLTLVEQGVFHKRQTERVRMLLNRVRDDRHDDVKYKELATRLQAIENQTGQYREAPSL